MNSRWSADSSTNETTADSPVVAAAKAGETRVVEAHRHLGGEILEQVPRQPELREDDQAGARVAGLGDQLVMARQVGLEVPEARGGLGERDAEWLHAPSLARASLSRAGSGRRRRAGEVRAASPGEGLVAAPGPSTGARRRGAGRLGRCRRRAGP